MTHVYKSNFGLGDVLLHCHWLRAASRSQPEDEFVFYCNGGEQAHEVVNDMPRIRIEQITPSSPGIPVPLTASHMPRGTDLTDFVACKIQQYKIISEQSGFESPINTREEWLFDYPALLNLENSQNLDFFVVNARPLSHQTAVTADEVSALAAKLTGYGHKVFCTNTSSDPRYSMTEMATASLRAKRILMIATGPSWLTFNIWNEKNIKERLIICNETVNFGRPWPHFHSIGQVEAHLRQNGLL